MTRALLLCALAGCASTATGSAGDLDALHRGLARNASDPEAHLRLGLHWARAGDGLRAQQYLERAWQLGADPRRALPPLVRVDLALSCWEAALRHADALSEVLERDCAARREPGVCAAAAEALSTTATLQDTLGRPLRARDLFLAALRANPRLGDAHLGLARIQAQVLGDPSAAADTLRRGIRVANGGAPAAEMRVMLDDLEHGGPR